MEWPDCQRQTIDLGNFRKISHIQSAIWIILPVLEYGAAIFVIIATTIQNTFPGPIRLAQIPRPGRPGMQTNASEVI